MQRKTNPVTVVLTQASIEETKETIIVLHSNSQEEAELPKPKMAKAPSKKSPKKARNKWEELEDDDDDDESDDEEELFTDNKAMKQVPVAKQPKKEPRPPKEEPDEEKFQNVPLPKSPGRPSEGEEGEVALDKEEEQEEQNYQHHRGGKK